MDCMRRFLLAPGGRAELSVPLLLTCNAVTSRRQMVLLLLVLYGRLAAVHLSMREEVVPSLQLRLEQPMERPGVATRPLANMRPPAQLPQLALPPACPVVPNNLPAH